MFLIRFGRGLLHSGRYRLRLILWVNSSRCLGWCFVRELTTWLIISSLIMQITLTGLMIVIINFATMLYYDPVYLTEKGGAVGPPQWLFFTWVISLSFTLRERLMCGWFALLAFIADRWAAGLFLYQSLDAIDGKQARRTGMAGPLGEMFDHGECFLPVHRILRISRSLLYSFIHRLRCFEYYGKAGKPIKRVFGSHVLIS